MRKSLNLILVGIISISLVKSVEAKQTREVRLGMDAITIDIDKRDIHEGVLIKKDEMVEEKEGYKIKIEKEVKGYFSPNGKFGVKVTNDGKGDFFGHDLKCYDLSYDSRIEYYDEFGNKVWEIDKPGFSAGGVRISDNGRFVFFESSDDQSIEENFEIYDSGGNLLLKRRRCDYTISPSGNIIFFEEEKNGEKYLSFINLETNEKWEREIDGYLGDISESDKYFLYNIGTDLYLYNTIGSLIWNKYFEKHIRGSFSLDEKFILCQPSSFIPSDDQIYLLETLNSKVILNIREVIITEGSKKVAIIPSPHDTAAAISLYNKYLAIGSSRKKGEDFVYICLLDSKGKLLWYDKIDIEESYPTASPRFSRDGKLLIVYLYDNPPERVYVLDEILKGE